MKASEFLAMFPAIKRDQSTGGGCTAWEIALARDAYVLITDGEDARQPALTAKRAAFGVCYDSGSVEAGPHLMTWAAAVPWLRGVLDADTAIRAAVAAPTAAAPREAVRMSAAEQFFYDKAGASKMPGETWAQGKLRGARALAAAEQQARDGGYSFHWSEDPTTDSRDFSDARPPWSLWQCFLRDRRGHGVVGSLHGIDFGRDGEPWGDDYRRVVEAELALEHTTK